MIEKLTEKARQAEDEAEVTKKVLYTFPTFQENPPFCNWHIEKDGVIIAKGKGAFQFCSLPYWVDLMTGEAKNNWKKDWGLSEEQEKDLKKFQSFINKVESVASVKVGEGEETTYKTITVTEYKKENKTEVINGDIEAKKDFILNCNFNYGCYKGLVYHIESIDGGYVLAYKYNKKLTKLCKGKASRNNRFYCAIDTLQKFINKGSISLVKIIEVNTPYEVEKCVKVEPKKKNKETEQGIEQTQNNLEYDIKQDVDTRDKSIIYVVKVIKSLSKKEYISVNKYMKSLGGYYSRFKHGFIFKENPEGLLNGEVNSSPNTSKEKELDNKQKNQEQQHVRKNKLFEKIDKQINSLQNKIDNLSGDYKTNTYKRMREQANRHSKIEKYELEINILNYLAEQLADRNLTLLEENLITSTFRNEIDNYFRQCKCNRDIKFPEINYQYPDSWWNKEVPKLQKRLQKADISNTSELIQAVEKYEKIREQVDKPVNEKERKIKMLESKYKLMQKGDINFTPSKVAEKLVKLAEINENSRVLEPSAGIGSIADIIRQTTQNIDVIECMSGFRELLQLKGYNLIGDDFLEFKGSQVYDAIIMNPPFSDEQRHVKHAYSMLKNGGVLVSITSPHWIFANDKKSMEFREWVEQNSEYIDDLESGTFEMTGVRAKIIVLRKREEQVRQEVA